jgi:hypothetical protein
MHRLGRPTLIQHHRRVTPFTKTASLCSVMGKLGTIKLLSLVDSLSTRLSFLWFSMGFACESHQSYFVIRGENSIGVLTKLVSQ